MVRENGISNSLKIIRLSEDNKNYDEALCGKWAQCSDGKGVFTIVKNLLFINLLEGAQYDKLVLPQCHDGFLICSDGSRIYIKESKLTCTLDSSTTAQGQLILKKWC